jgi:hypothetical protein
MIFMGIIREDSTFAGVEQKVSRSIWKANEAIGSRDARLDLKQTGKRDRDKEE